MDETMGQGVGSGMPQPAPQQPAMALPPMGIPGAMPAQPAVAMQPQPPPLHQEMNADDDAWWSDLKNNHVSPKSYKELLANKGTLGKIGSLFGLLLSGAGSGLTGQPNLVMQMMDKEIANDFESQKANAANRVNFYSLAMQHERDKIAAKSADIDNQLKQAQIARNPMEIARLEQEKKLLAAQTRSMDAESQIKGTTAALNKQKLAMVHSLLGITDTMPDGPMKQKATATLNDVIIPAVMADNQARNQQAAGQVGLFNAMNNAMDMPEQQFQKTVAALRIGGADEAANALVEQRKSLANKSIPGVPGYTKRDIPEDARKEYQATTGFLKELKHLKDWTESVKGLQKLDPRVENQGKIYAKSLQSAYRKHELGTVYNEKEQKMIEDIIASDPAKFFSNARILPQLEALETTGALKLENQLRTLGFEGPPKKPDEDGGGAPPLVKDESAQDPFDLQEGEKVLYRKSDNMPFIVKGGQVIGPAQPTKRAKK